MTILLDTLTALAPMTVIIPDPAPVQPPGTGGFTTFMGWLKWGGYAVGAAALICLAIMMMIKGRRGEGSELMTWGARIAGGVIVIGAGAGIIGTLAGA